MDELEHLEPSSRSPRHTSAVDVTESPNAAAAAEMIRRVARDSPAQVVLVLCRGEQDVAVLDALIEPAMRPFVQYIWELDEDQEYVLNRHFE